MFGLKREKKVSYKLGKLPVVHDERTLKASKYMGAVTPPPESVDWQSNVQFNLFRNDYLGDCTCATIGHCIQRWTYDATGQEITVTDDDVVQAYSAVSGYDPATGANDNGAVELHVLNYWRKTGLAGHQIAAYVELDTDNLDQIKQAVNLFGAVYIGIVFPASAMDQFNNGQPWDVVEGSKMDGGHAVSIGAYDSNTKMFEVVTWGSRQKMTEAFFHKYCDEAYAVLSHDWFNETKDPQGLDLTTLQQDLTNIGKNQPNVEPTPEPIPEPVPTPLDADQEFIQAANLWLSYVHHSPVNATFVDAVQKWLATK